MVMKVGKGLMRNLSFHAFISINIVLCSNKGLNLLTAIYIDVTSSHRFNFYCSRRMELLKARFSGLEGRLLTVTPRAPVFFARDFSRRFSRRYRRCQPSSESL